MNSISNPNNKYTFIDLFAGAGGLTLGFENQGFLNIFSLDNEKSYCQTYKANFPHHTLIESDIQKIQKKEILELIKKQKVDVIVGGPPCQGFSIAGNIGRKFIDDPRNNLFREFARFVQEIKPKIFVMENVARLYTHKNGQTRKEIIELFESFGYKVDCKILKTELYNIPQKRSRVVFIGNRIKKNNIFPLPITTDINFKSIESTIEDLPTLYSGQTSQISNHIAMKHTVQMLEKMSYIPEGGDRSSIPLKIRPKSGDTRKYIRLNRKKPIFCITGDMRKIFHYSQNRALTVRELARLQTFPDNFIFKGNTISQQQQVGNAVPPHLAELLANSVKIMLNEK